MPLVIIKIVIVILLVRRNGVYHIYPQGSSCFNPHPDNPCGLVYRTRNNYYFFNLNRERRKLRNVSERCDTKETSLMKRRFCLKCGIYFLSVGPNNRICKKCVSTNGKIAHRSLSVSVPFRTTLCLHDKSNDQAFP